MTETSLTPPESDKTSLGLERNTAALLSYFFTPLLGIVLYLIERNNKYVRFHALQSILFGFAWIIASGLLFVLNWLLGKLPLLGGFLTWSLTLVYLIGSIAIVITLMLKAYRGDWYKLPFIGDIAERNV